jgi:NADH:ubiquinone oxidoreductase subunit 5 (subunit L)/multisubunit Na+/H+ antiporter MnhA subunit
MAKPDLSSQYRDGLVNRLPITLLVIFIITLYLAAIPFGQTLMQGRIWNLQQDLGFILAFNVLIPLLLLYAHYFVLIRLPYGRGQSRWRKRHAEELKRRLRRTEHEISDLQRQIDRSETAWKSRFNVRATPEDRIDKLYDLVELNSKRDNLNMQRLQIIAEQQELAEISEAPVALTVARLPLRVFRLGIPLVLAFKIYEWAIVEGGLREVASNPNVGVLEFFQTILENTNF